MPHYVIEASMRIGVKADSELAALEWVEAMDGAPIDNDGVILAVWNVAPVLNEEGQTAEDAMAADAAAQETEPVG